MDQLEQLLKITTHVADIIHNGVVWIDRRGHILSYNRQLAEDLGYDNSDIPMPQTIFQMNPDINLTTWDKYWKELAENRQISFMTDHISADGGVFPVEMKGFLLDIKGQQVCWAIVKNIFETDRYLNLLKLTSKMSEIGIWEWDILKNEFLLTDRVYELANVVPVSSPKKEWILNQLQSLISRSDYYYFLRGLTAGMKAGNKFEMEFNIRNKSNGSDTKTLLIKVVPIVHKGKTIEVYGTVEDVSKVVKRNKEMFLAYDTLAHSTEMIFWLNDDYTLFSANHTFCKILDYTKEELANLHAGDFLIDFDAGKYQEEWKQLRKEKEIQKDTLIKNKTGRSLFVESRVALCSHNGKELYCGILQDATVRKRLEVQREVRMNEIENLQKQMCQSCHIESDNSVLAKDIELKYNFENIISNSEEFKKVLVQVEKVAPTNTTVLITGETGTGKELLARTVHKLSKRSHRPFISVNCAALPPSLIESELFGHEKGAFTGSVQQKKGLFELAHEKTLFLDEIGELPLELQPKLLRILQEGELERVGGSKTIKIDARIISATNQKLWDMVNEGKFREDLYYRLNVFPIHSLPLRERKEDIPLLIKHFIEKHSPNRKIEKIPKVIVDKLFRYDFPGNIRELENIVERALVLSTGKYLNLDAAFNPGTKKQNNRNEQTLFKTLDEIQKEHILRALQQTKWRLSGKMGAATLLGVNPKTLWSKLKKLGIESPANDKERHEN